MGTNNQIGSTNSKFIQERINMTQNRFKSKVFWAAIAAQIVTILILVGVINTGLGETVNQIIAIVLQMFVAFGVLNDPTDKNNF